MLQVGSSGTCALGVQPGVPDMLNDTIVLGTNFLRAYYSTYTYNASSRSSSVQLAPAVQPAPGPANNSTILACIFAFCCEASVCPACTAS
jgi:hypothetical protein